MISNLASRREVIHCSWIVYEIVDQYLNGGSTVYGYLLDCSKTFDTVKHSKLFMKLVCAGFPPIVVWLLTAIYRNQTANVRWKGKISEEFPIRMVYEKER